jgi:hypothetical protein
MTPKSLQFNADFYICVIQYFRVSTSISITDVGENVGLGGHFEGISNDKSDAPPLSSSRQRPHTL